MEKLRFIQRVRADKEYLYFRHPNGLRAALPDEPEDSEAFLEAYQELLMAAEAMPKKRPSENEKGIRKLILRSKARAAIKGIEFDLSVGDVTTLMQRQNRRCALTGIRLGSFKDGGKISPWTPSLDRIDHAEGYVRENVRIVCTMANFARNSFSDDEFYLMCRRAAGLWRRQNDG